MCVIAICRKKRLTDETIDLMWNANPHGAGLAYQNKGEIVVQKGLMSVEEFKRAYRKAPTRCVVHFRIATSGGISRELTHPFTISENPVNALAKRSMESVLFHNGHVLEAEDFMLRHCIQNGIEVPDGTWSDSRIVAFLTASLGRNALQLFDGKFAVMATSGIYTFGEFEEVDGVLVSNTGWKSSFATRFLSTTKKQDIDNAILVDEIKDDPIEENTNDWIGYRGGIFNGR